jgi:hypothetical protein
MILNIGNTEERFELTSRVLEVINNLHLANELYEETRSPRKIDASILYDVIETIYKDKHFTDEQLLSCYSIIDELGIFHDTMTKFTDKIEVTLPLEVNLLLFGLNAVEQNELSNEQLFEYESIISENLHCNSFDKPDLIGRIENVKNCIHKELAA